MDNKDKERLDQISAKLDELLADTKMPNIYYEKNINELSAEEFAKFIYTLCGYEQFKMAHIYFVNSKPSQFDDKYIFPRDLFHKIYDTSQLKVEVTDRVVSYPLPTASEYLSDWMSFNMPHIQATFFLQEIDVQIKFTQFPRYESPFAISVLASDKYDEKKILLYLEEIFVDAIEHSKEVFAKSYC